MVTGQLKLSGGATGGQLLIGDALGIPTFTTLGGDATLDSSGTITLATVNTAPGTFGNVAWQVRGGYQKFVFES